MHPIPNKVRKEVAADPFMAVCVYDLVDLSHECTKEDIYPVQKRVEWEHVFIYAGKQIQEAWNIIPVCTYHHRGLGLDKRFHEYIALRRANIADLMQRYPRTDWLQKFKYLSKKYGHLKIKIKPVTYKPMSEFNKLKQLGRDKVRKLRSKARQKITEGNKLNAEADQLEAEIEEK